MTQKKILRSFEINDPAIKAKRITNEIKTFVKLSKGYF